MENNANEAHIFWKSPDQQTEVWMKQVSGKTPEEKKEQSRSGYRLLAEMIKTRYAYDLEKETDSVMRTETGKPYLRLHPELFFNISHSGEWIACALGNVPVGIDIRLPILRVEGGIPKDKGFLSIRRRAATGVSTAATAPKGADCCRKYQHKCQKLFYPLSFHLLSLFLLCLFFTVTS